MTKIYIDNNKNLVVINLSVTPNIKQIFKSTDQIFIEIEGDVFSIRKVGTDVRYVFETYDAIQDLEGTNYTSMNDLLIDIQPFFVSSDFSTLIAAVQNSGGTTLKAFSNIMVRPVGGGTNVYAAGDVVGQLLTISNVAKSDGTGVRISRVRLQTNDTGVAGKKFNIHIYRDVPTIASDNAPFAIDWANHLKRVGVFPIVLGVGNLGTVGMNDYNEITLNPLAKDIYFAIETVDGFTPSASNTEFQITIDCELSNN